MPALYLARYGAYLRYHNLSGVGPARVYLHGLGGAATLFLHTALHPALAGRRAILVDLLGFGLSGRPDNYAYTLADHADAVAALLDHLDLRGCDSIGHHLGGHVAIALAVRRPDLVGRLVLAEAPLVLGPHSASLLIAAQEEQDYVASGHRAFTNELRAEAADDPATAGYFGAFGLASPLALHRSATSLVHDGARLRHRLLRLPIPRAYLWGERTLADPEQAALSDILARNGITTAVVPDAGQQLQIDNPAAFAQTLARLLDAAPA